MVVLLSRPTYPAIVAAEGRCTTLASSIHLLLTCKNRRPQRMATARLGATASVFSLAASRTEVVSGVWLVGRPCNVNRVSHATPPPPPRGISLPNAALHYYLHTCTTSFSR